VSVATLLLIASENAIYARGVSLAPQEWVYAIIVIIGAIELTRRATGLIIPILIILALTYPAFWGQHMDGVFRFAGLSVETIIFRTIFTDEGMFGTIANISATFVFLFILFGAFLVRSGAGEFIIDLARAVAGKLVGGPGLCGGLFLGPDRHHLRLGGGQHRLDRRHHHPADEALGLPAAFAGGRGGGLLHRRAADAADHGRRRLRDGELHPDPLSRHRRRQLPAGDGLLPVGRLLRAHRGQEAQHAGLAARTMRPRPWTC
jgi:hypothetical protein